MALIFIIAGWGKAGWRSPARRLLKQAHLPQ